MGHPIRVKRTSGYSLAAWANGGIRFYSVWVGANETNAVPPRPDLADAGQPALAKSGPVCANCGEPLSRMRRWMGKDLCEQCEDIRDARNREAAQQRRAALDAAQSTYRTLLDQVAMGA